MPQRGRSGIILIIIVGMAGLLASLAIAFIAKVQLGREMTAEVMRESQNRLMLHAACCYILEAGRMGYDDDAWLPPSPMPRQHREAFGWVDVRDGQPGPKDQIPCTTAAGSPGVPVQPVANCWPNIGGTVIQPMHRLRRPPFAIRLQTVYNPIPADAAQRASNPDWGRPYLINPDPQPAVDNGYATGSIPASAWDAFATGDATPVADSVGIAWFRIARISQSRFVITCGSGGTMGFKDWNEVMSPPSTVTLAHGISRDPASLFGSRQAFVALQAAELRTWYEVQWSGGVCPSSRHLYPPDPATMNYPDPTPILFSPLNGSLDPRSGSTVGRYNPAPLGSITYIQRLDGPPGGTHPDTGQAWFW